MKQLAELYKDKDDTHATTTANGFLYQLLGLLP
jgi:hypothetical protein